MSRRRSGLRNAAEYVASRSILALARGLPDRALAPLSNGLGAVLDAVLAGRRQVVAENAGYAFGRAATHDARPLSRASFANLCRSFLELDRLPEDPERVKASITFRDPAAWTQLQEVLRSGPVVFSASHFGAYEISGIAASCLGVPLTTLVRPLDNPMLEAYLGRIRGRFGQALASNRGGARTLVTALRSGRSVAVLVDLNKRGKSVFVDYFGRPAATAPTAAQLAWLVGRPLVPVFSYRASSPMTYTVDLGPPLWPRRDAPRGEEIRRLLQAATHELERRVRESPLLWLWTHRRWKSRPAGEAGGSA